MLLAGPSNPSVDGIERIELLDFRILLEDGRHVVDGRFRRWLQEDQASLKGRGGSRCVDDSLSVGDFGDRDGGDWWTGLGDGHRGGDRARGAPSSGPRRDQANFTGDVRRPPGHGQPPQRLHGGSRRGFIGRFAVFVLTARLALPLRLYLSVHHVRRAQAAGFLRLVLTLLHLRAGEEVLRLREHGLPRLHERPSRHVHPGWVVQRVLRAIGQR